MKVKFNLELFKQPIPIEINVPDDYIEEALDECNNDIKVAVNELLSDELENTLIETWEPA